jgi:hypothetical protein
LRSLARHSRGSLFVRCSLHTSTFLAPLAPRALPRFLAVMGPLTPARPTALPPPLLRTGLPGSHRATFHAFRHHPPDAPHHRFSMSLQRDGLPGRGRTPVPPPSPGLGFALESQARRNARPYRVRSLRTACSSSVAPHTASRQRSYFRLPGVDISRKRTFTFLIARASRRTIPACAGVTRRRVFQRSRKWNEKRSMLPFFDNVPIFS